MRQIKFRAWDSNTNKMNFPMEFSQEGISIPNEYLSHEETDILFRAGRFGVTLMQYIGIKDINDIEIYEGDILKNFWIFNEDLVEVEYNSDGCNFSFNGWKFDQRRSNHIEVVGNIYENPELLT